jgi:hypothetical protein
MALDGGSFAVSEGQVAMKLREALALSRRGSR